MAVQKNSLDTNQIGGVRRVIINIATFALLIIAALFYLVPFAMVIINSFTYRII